MKDRLLIVGAGGFGREVLGWARDVPDHARSWEFAGFLDDTVKVPDKSASRVPVLGTISGYRAEPGDVLVLAVGEPRAKLALYQELRQRGARFASVVHPTAIIAGTAQCGDGLIACPGALISNDAVVGHAVSLNAYASVGHDATIGAGTTISSYCDVTGRVKIGTGAFLGSRASILPGLDVGEFAVIGAGSVVVRSVPAGVTVFGVPARRISGGQQTETMETE